VTCSGNIRLFNEKHRGAKRMSPTIIKQARCGGDTCNPRTQEAKV
jgi:hypothetical protein